MTAYLDNAATTPLDPSVLEEMLPLFREHFGNPSSIHAHGRKVRTLIEKSRKKVADLLNTSPAEIFFTSGGTEADNTALRSSVSTLGVDHIITSRIEHHAVLHTAEILAARDKVKLSFVELDGDGVIRLESLKQLLEQKSTKTLVTLMQGNNEIGNLLDLEVVGQMTREHDALFHSDTVQSMGHLPHNLAQLPVDFLVGSAHKFHGPKGIGFLHIDHGTKIEPFVHGGGQERNMRGGTENVAGIVGLAKALEIAYSEMEAHQNHIEGLKTRMISRLKHAIDDVQFNGLSDQIGHSLYTVLSVCLPPSDQTEMLLFNLDIAGISASGGSACTSGSNVGSHVLAELDRDQERGAVRFSFSKYTTTEEVDYAADKLAELYPAKVIS